MTKRGYEKSPIIITSNKAFEQWREIFLDDVLGFVTAEVNHATNQKLQKGLKDLYHRLCEIEESYKIIDAVLEAMNLVERWRLEYNHFRPHSSLGYRPPAPGVFIPAGGGKRKLNIN